LECLTRGRIGRPPIRLDASWVTEQYDALTLAEEDEDSDDFSRISKIAERHQGVEIPVLVG